MATESEDLSGTSIDGRYQLTARIGRGGMGSVYQATVLEDGSRVAIKIVSPGAAKVSRQGTRFKRELQALRRVDHPNTVRVFDAGRTDAGRLWIAMELARGVSLSRRVREAPLPAPEIERVLRQLLQALGAVHAAGLVHRDLKPGNIMVDHVGDGVELKLLDFGIVRFVNPDPDMSALTGRNTILGTPEYMSPELIQTGNTDARSDLYAAGVVAFKMATGRVPFAGKTAAVLKAHVQQVAPDVQELRAEPLPGPLARTITALLQKHPRDRPQSAEQALALLDGGRLPRRMRQRTRNTLIFGGAAVLGVLVGVVVLVVARMWGGG